jgi:hypothetical protein
MFFFFAAVTHLAEVPCLNARLALVVQDTLLCLLGSQISIVSMVELQVIFVENISKK